MKILKCLIFLTITILAGCSGDRLAGGTGAGNSGGPASFAIKAENDSDLLNGLGKCAASPFSISDSSGNSVVFTNGLIAINRLSFQVASEYVPSELVSQAGLDLTYDRYSIFIEGPFTFDVLGGTVIPSLDTIILPVAKYNSITLELADNTESPSFDFDGELVYSGKTVNLTLQIYGPNTITYKLDKNIFTITKDDTMHLLLNLSAIQWFQNVDFGRLILSNKLKIDSTNTIHITNDSQGDQDFIARQIQRQIMNSGKLKSKKS